jgi:ubiquinone/menaquinone biosynthesis C-methylase UbiE
MRHFYEEAWQDAPQDPEPWRWEWRRGLLLDAIRPGDRWLDLGCGAGRFLTLAPNGTGADIAQAALDRAEKNASQAVFTLAGEDGTLPFAHNSFDLVWCSETLEHVPDALGLLQEARRLLKRGARLVVTTPAHPLWRRTLIAIARFDQHFDPLGQHLRFFTKRSLRGALEAAGFRDIDITTKHATLVARCVS